MVEPKHGSVPPVLIQFDCYPFRSASRLDIPFDAPEDFRQLCHRFVKALRQYGTDRTYYLYNATIEFRFSNGPDGRIKFAFEGTVWTDTEDRKTTRLDISTRPISSDFGELDPAVRQFFDQVIPRAVIAEFDRFIEAGFLQKTVEQAKEAMLQSEQTGGYMGMNI